MWPSASYGSNYVDFQFEALNFNAYHAVKNPRSFFEGFEGQGVTYKAQIVESSYSTDLQVHLYTNSRDYYNNLTNFSAQSSTIVSCRGTNSPEGLSGRWPVGTVMTYNGQKTYTVPEQHNPIGFVIGNNASQYPSNGQKGDYWYELIGQVASTNALSLTDDATNLIKNIAVEEIKQEVILNVD